MPISSGFAESVISLVEIMSPCPTAYGKVNKLGRGVDLIMAQKQQAVRVEQAKKMSADELRGKTVIGVLADKELPEYITTYNKITSQAQRRYL